jgi:hypothetical protein
MTGIAAKRCPQNTSMTTVHKPPAIITAWSRKRRTLFHEEERIARIIRYAANTASRVMTVIVYGIGAQVAKRHIGQTMTNPAAMHTITSAADFPTEASCFLIEIRIFFTILKSIKNRLLPVQKPVCLKTESAYSSAIAEVGHSLAHVPQLIHFAASILRALSSSAIAPTGQSGSHVPQFTHLALSIL